ncbi:MAG TPA: hypothetical protein VE466_16715 [Acidimicrobiales bacterium]|nr:hypothetical protein [Acidimicrobiales bacterium]
MASSTPLLVVAGVARSGVPVQVKQPGGRLVALRAGDDAEAAVATQNDRQRTVGERPESASGTVRAIRTTVARLRALDVPALLATPITTT